MKKPSSRERVWLIIILMAALILIGDATTELGVAVGMLYIIPIIVTIWLNDERSTIAITIVFSILTILTAFVKPVFAAHVLTIAVSNRIMMLTSQWITVFICTLEIRRKSLLEETKHELLGSRNNLKQKVDERTMELSKNVVALRNEVAARKKTESDLMASESELKLRKMELEARVEQRTDELRNEKERLSITLRSIGDAVIATDTQARIITMNRVAEQLTGWTSEEALGKLLEDVFVIVNERTRERIPNPVQEVLNSGQIIGLANHTVLISRNGTERIIGDSGAPVRDEKGSTVGVVLVFRDLTMELKSLEEIERTGKLESIAFLPVGSLTISTTS